MPGFDGSGPIGAGAMTGGRRGFCNTTDRVDAAASGARYGLGRGCRGGRFFAVGSGRKFERGFCAEGPAVSAPIRTASPPDDLEHLSQEAQNLERNLQMIKQRIDDLRQKSE